MTLASAIGNPSRRHSASSFVANGGQPRFLAFSGVELCYIVELMVYRPTLITGTRGFSARSEFAISMNTTTTC